MSYTFAAAIFAVCCFAALPCHATTLEGKVVHVRDADTIEIATDRGRFAVRLNGVDAPELNERGGQAGKRWMQRTYRNAIVTCNFNGQRSYDRWIAVCFDKNGADIGAAVINAGHARDCPRYSGGRYRKYETEASRAIPPKRYCR
ncbi:thermonuclease family protein [Ruegeria sp. HKCCD7318]|uniref:thermonuclease family protein n=1 Tax=Ruegeria sp. HKCCD7318 TaxID=2683014 RepID=UPI0020A0A89B|nr:thermonuclease family protein [Ruegeria sp. HKCCD7318]